MNKMLSNVNYAKMLVGQRTSLAWLLFAAVSAVPSIGAPLPVNEDMVNAQPKTGQFARESSREALPLGLESRALGEDRSFVVGFKNPLKSDAESIEAGRRFFEVQCSTCHGTYDEKNGERIVSPITQFLPAPPDLALPEIAAKSDWHFFQYIHYGGVAAMPAYGYKASLTEHWDTVNYIRSFQDARKK